MNLNNIKIGETYKNYKELCKILGEEIKTGGINKKYQIKEWERHFSFTKQGQKITITEIYDTPKEKIDNRGKNKGERTKKITDLSYGVYMLKSSIDSDIYIGSTTTSFHLRHLQHLKYPTSSSKIVINKPHELIKLWVAPLDSTEQQIRNMENYYINKYKLDPNYNLVNIQQNQNQAYETLHIAKEDLARILYLANLNNIKIKEYPY